MIVLTAILGPSSGSHPISAASPSNFLADAESPAASPPTMSSEPATATSSPGGGAVPSATADATAADAGATQAFPLEAYPDSVLIAPGPDGGAYTLIQTDTTALIALLGVDGTVQRGWPIRIESSYCRELLAANDGTIRAVCDAPQEGDGLQAPVTRIFAIDASGRALAGWPVDIEGGTWSTDMIGTQITIVVRPYQGDAPPEGTVDTARLAVISQSGAVRMGTSEQAVPCCSSDVAGHGVVGYVISRDYGDPSSSAGDSSSTHLQTFGLDGPGWRVTLDGIASAPAFDAHSKAYLSVWRPIPGTSRIVVLDDVGRVVATSPEDLPVVPTSGWTGAGDGSPVAPIVDDDGRTFIVDDRDSTRVLAVSPSGTPYSDWPYESTGAIAYSGRCYGEDTGCGQAWVPPQIGSDGTLYVAFQPDRATAGGALIALGRVPRVQNGWPVGLKRAGAEFWKIMAGSDGGLWALAVEPETDGDSATLLSIAPDSSIRGNVTIIEP